MPYFLMSVAAIAALCLVAAVGLFWYDKHQRNNQDGYVIHVGSYWVNANEIVIKALPKLPSEMYMWEVFNEEEAGETYLVLNLYSVLTGKSEKVRRQMVSRRKHGQDWNSLDGCGENYISKRVTEEVIDPFCTSARSKVKGLGPSVSTMKNYKLI